MATSSGEPISTVSHQVANKVIVIEDDHNNCNNNNNLNIESSSSPNSTNNNNFNNKNEQSNQLAIKSLSLTRNTTLQQQQQLQPDAITKSSSTQNIATPTGISSHSQIATPTQQAKLQHNLTASTQVLNSTPNPYAQINKRKETLEAKRERKAAKTLAIITGAYR
jgi:5-hydroxytryptamine receptor 1